MKVLALVVSAFVLTPASFVDAEEFPLLSGFPGVADVVAGSAHPSLPEARIRALVEHRLKRVGLLLEGGASDGARLLVRVSGDHNTSSSGVRYSFYDVALTVTESASLDRDSSVRLPAVVWQKAMRVGTFAAEVPEQSVIDKVGDLLNAFTAAVATKAPIR